MLVLFSFLQGEGFDYSSPSECFNSFLDLYLMDIAILTVTVRDDDIAQEGNETFHMFLDTLIPLEYALPPGNRAFLKNRFTVTIIDNDSMLIKLRSWLKSC